MNELLPPVVIQEGLSAGIKVVEVGHGCNPACDEGWLFNNPRVWYEGIELYSHARSWYQEGRFADGPNRTFVEGEFARLPYPDASVNYVLARSVFGQRSHIGNCRLGILEAARVLCDGGQLVISEENTPYDASDLWDDLVYAGFGIRDFYYTNPSSAHQWNEVRRPFYTREISEIHDDAPGGWWGRPYILIAEKRPGIERVSEEQPFHPLVPRENDNPIPQRSGDIGAAVMGRFSLVKSPELLPELQAMAASRDHKAALAKDSGREHS